MELVRPLSCPLCWHAYLSCTPSTPACQSTLGQMAYLRSSASQPHHWALPAAEAEKEEEREKRKLKNQKTATAKSRPHKTLPNGLRLLLITSKSVSTRRDAFCLFLLFFLQHILLPPKCDLCHPQCTVVDLWEWQVREWMANWRLLLLPSCHSRLLIGKLL